MAGGISELSKTSGLPRRGENSLLEGPAARALLSAADARNADEIVVGSRGFGPVRGALGSVSHALLRDADRVVVVVPDASVADA